jgi:hypothetical protein
MHRPAHGPSGRPAAWSVRSFAKAGLVGELDLRDPADAAALEDARARAPLAPV